jgi:hypothetical protein
MKFKILTMRIEDIEQFFEGTVPKITLRKASEDTANGISLIDSEELVFNYDSLKGSIKSSDIIYFKQDKVIFVEFKNGNIKPIDFRLKATEGLMTFIRHIKKKAPPLNVCFPNDCLEIHYVYNDATTTSTRLEEYNRTIKLLGNEYAGAYSKLKMIKASDFNLK